MKKSNLTRYEMQIEKALLNGEYKDVGKQEFDAIAKAVAARKKDAVLNIRVNSLDLEQIKLKSKKLGIKYQTLISEMIHRLAA